MINCEIKIRLKWTKNCVVSEISRTFRTVGDPRVQEVATKTTTTGVIFQRNNAEFYVPVVALSINDNIKFLENINERLKRKISWNKYRFEIATQPKNNNSDNLIDPTFRNINRLFVLSFITGNDDPTR